MTSLDAFFRSERNASPRIRPGAYDATVQSVSGSTVMVTIDSFDPKLQYGPMPFIAGGTTPVAGVSAFVIFTDRGSVALIAS